MMTWSAFALGDAKPTLKIGYAEEGDDSVATTNVAAHGSPRKAVVPGSARAARGGRDAGQGVARGDLGATLSAWLPVTQGAYWDQFKTKVVDLGPNFTEARHRPHRSGIRQREER
ncbi:glycine betaine ABC transporter substrate-binding protein [Cupriavidus basilensis]